MSSPSERDETLKNGTLVREYLVPLVIGLSGAAVVWCFSPTLSMVVGIGVLILTLAKYKRIELLLAYLGIVLVILTFWEIRDLEIGAHTHDSYVLFLDGYLPKAKSASPDAEYFSGLITYENVRWLAENNHYLANSRNRPTFPLLRPFVMLSTENREGIRFVDSYQHELKRQMQAQFEIFKSAQLSKLASLPNDDDRVNSLYKLAALGLYLGKYTSVEAARADLDKGISDPALRNRFDSKLPS